MKLRKRLKSSRFVVGVARSVRGLILDLRVVVWLGKRKRKIATYLGTHPMKKLQLAASNNLLPGWLNTDVFPNHESVAYLDATRQFPFDDDTFDCIMSEHMIEHIEYRDAQFMLRECFRVLKPGGRVRVATPDLGVLLALHSKQRTSSQQNYINWAIARFVPGTVECKDVFVINNFFQSWGHRFLYDQETLGQVLQAAGFSDIRFYKPGDSDEPTLKNLERHGKELQSEEINQFETIVVEGLKENVREDSIEGQSCETVSLDSNIRL